MRILRGHTDLGQGSGMSSERHPLSRPRRMGRSKVWPIPTLCPARGPAGALKLVEMEQELGFIRAVIIVWVSGAVVSVLIGMLVSPIAWAMIAGSGRQIDARWGSVLVVVGINALLGAIGVTVGVGLFGYRLSYPSAVFALAVGAIAAVAVTRFLFMRSTSTPSGVPLPVFTPVYWPLSVLLGTLLPAFIVNTLASRRSYPTSRDAPPEPPLSGRSPYV